MNKIFYCLNNQEILNFFKEILNSYYLDIEFDSIENGLNSHDSIFITDNESCIDKIDIANNYVLFLTEKKEYERENVKSILFPDELNPTNILRYFEEMDSIHYKKHDSSLCRMTISEFINSKIKTNTSIYLKLPSNKYIKIMDSDSIDFERLNNYRNKKVNYLYIEEEAYKEYVENNFLKFIKKVKDNNLTKEVQEKVHQAFHTLGQNESQKMLVESTIKESLSILRRNKELKGFLELMKNSNNFLSDHSYFTMYLASWIASLQGWNHEQTLKKISLAAFFHDMSLRKEEYIRFNGTKKELEAKYKNSTRLDLMLHPMRSASILEEFLDLPDDSRNIILEHHERPDGSGFPTGKSGNYISPLSCIFIMAHEVSHRIDYSKEKISTKEIIKKLLDLKEEGFYSGNFKKPFNSVIEYVQKKNN